MIQQTKFTYSPLGKTLQKKKNQTKKKQLKIKDNIIWTFKSFKLKKWKKWQKIVKREDLV